MAPRSRLAWLPLLLGLYLVGIIAYIAATRWTTLATGHPAYPITLAVVGLGALLTIVVALARGRRR
jgi:hypothetical protein